MTLDTEEPVSLEEQETKKYEKCWDDSKYRIDSPAEGLIKYIFEAFGPPEEGANTFYDYGTGCGRAALYFAMTGYDVTPIDLADNCQDAHVAAAMKNKLVVASLWDLPKLDVAAYGLCTDVMEHIPEEKVRDVLQNISNTCHHCYFNIAFMEDHFGQRVDEVLHLTIKPFRWWRDLLGEFGKVVEARDRIMDGIYRVDFNHG